MEEDAGTTEEDAGPLPVDAGPDAYEEPCDGPPGLYVDADCTVLAEGVRPYSPQYWLWTDAADKQRFVWFPEGRQIDTRDPDNWVYPVGTRVWKTFLVDGVKIETRLLEKRRSDTGLDGWSFRVFVWNEAQDAVTEIMDGMENAMGTDHDVPTIEQCVDCHAEEFRGPVDVLRSVTAIQLNNDSSAFSLDDMMAEGLLSHEVSRVDAQIPGDGIERAALGYLHANCGHCHGGTSPQVGLDLWVDVGLTDVEETSAYQTALGVDSRFTLGEAVLRVAPGHPERSTVFVRAMMRNTEPDENVQMPPLGTEVPDESGLAALEAWIAGMSD